MNAPVATPLTGEKENVVNTRTDLATYEDRPQAVAPATPMQMLQHALQTGASVEMMEKLLALQERWEANQARKAFDAAMAAAKADLPLIIKNREVDFTSQKGRTNYRHEDLAGIAKQIDPILARNGLSYRFRTEVENGLVTVTCIVSHRDGYSEENSLSAGRDESGNKNHIQAIGSTITYLQRYTLKAALGLAASHDDDGRGSEPAETISEEQVADLRDLIERVQAVESTFVEKFLQPRFGFASLAEITTDKLEAAVKELKRYGQKKGIKV